MGGRAGDHRRAALAPLAELVAAELAPLAELVAVAVAGLSTGAAAGP